MQPLFVVLDAEPHSHRPSRAPRILAGLQCSQVRLQHIAGDLTRSSNMILPMVVVAKTDTLDLCWSLASRRSAAWKISSLVEPAVVVGSAPPHVGRVDLAAWRFAAPADKPVVVGRTGPPGASCGLPAPVVHRAESPTFGRVVAASNTTVPLRRCLHPSWTRKRAVSTPPKGKPRRVENTLPNSRSTHDDVIDETAQDGPSL